MSNPLLINAAELLRRPGTERTVEQQITVGELGITDDPRLRADAEVDVDVRLESLTDGIVVDGRVRAPWVGTCRRCLADAAGVTDSDVHELYQLVVTDPEAFEIIGDQVDLRRMVREVVLLDAPVTPLCKEDCAGLCPQCGVDRNTVSCDCAAGTCTCTKDDVATKSVPFAQCSCTPTREQLLGVYTSCGFPY